MDEFESYFKSLNFNFSSWHEILENENIDVKSNNCEIINQTVKLLPRQDVSLYGIIPKMEKRSFSTCKECKHVFNPKDILLHKNCSFKVKSQHVSHFKKKVKSKKKSPVPLPPLFPTGLEGVTPIEELNSIEIRQNSIYIVNANKLPAISADVNPMLPKNIPLNEDIGNIPLPSAPISPALLLDDKINSEVSLLINSQDKSSKVSSSHTILSSHSSSKSKKKKYAKSHRESESNSESGNSTSDHKGSSSRSIKYSNHSNGDDHYHRSKKSRNYKSEYFSQNDTQEIPISVPIMYMPMSPVATMTPLKIIQEGDLVCLENSKQVCTPSTECTHEVYFTIPDHLNVVYKTRPKLGSLPLYGARKMGGAIVISKQKLNIQRKDILAAINSKHKPNDILSNYKSITVNNSHRLNILKNKNSKLNLKKTSTDKNNISNDIKHIHLTSDVNGFVIHTDISKNNEDQQNSIHDGKISVMNIK